jgi:DNA-binding SARP family transcriptional activator
MRYQLLGPIEVARDDGTLVELTAPRERALLAALLLNANRVVSVSRLIDALWGENPPLSASNALQVHVSKLRKKLARGSRDGDVVKTAGSGYSISVKQGELDVERFEQILSDAASGEPSEVSAVLNEALSLWRGPALSDVASAELAGEAARLDELRLAAFERRVDADLTLGRHRDLVPELEGLVRQHPLREGLRAQLMLAMYRSGRQAEALTVYRQGRKVLAEQLGIARALRCNPLKWPSCGRILR